MTANQPYNPGAPTNQTFDLYAPTNQPYNPGPPANQTFNPYAPANQPYNPGAPANQPYNPGPTANQTFNPGLTANPANQQIVHNQYRWEQPKAGHVSIDMPPYSSLTVTHHGIKYKVRLM